MVRRQQTGASRDDALSIVIVVAGKREVKAIFQADEPLHRVRRRRVRSNASVPVERHETERRIDSFADHREIEAVPIGYCRPVPDPRAAERIDAEPQSGVRDSIEIENAAEIADVRIEKSMNA